MALIADHSNTFLLFRHYWPDLISIVFFFLQSISYQQFLLPPGWQCGQEWVFFQYIVYRFSGNDYFTDIENNIINFEFSECEKRGSCPAEKCICRFNDLTPREIEIVKLIAQGYCDKEIAYILNISTYTMPVHKRNIHHKLETLSKPQIATWAVKHNIF